MFSLKDDLAKQHAKVAEEAVPGWEKAQNEAAALKQQLDASLSKVSALEDRNTHLNSALKECVRQLWQGREEQNQKIEEALNKKCTEWESTKSELESRVEELQARLLTGKQEDPKLEALEKENSALKLQLLSKSEEVEIRTLERDLSTQAAESASKQQLEGIKKLTISAIRWIRIMKLKMIRVYLIALFGLSEQKSVSPEVTAIIAGSMKTEEEELWMASKQESSLSHATLKDS